MIATTDSMPAPVAGRGSKMRQDVRTLAKLTVGNFPRAAHDRAAIGNSPSLLFNEGVKWGELRAGLA